MIDSKYLKTIRKDLHDYALVRREIIKQSGDALHHAKRAIFSVHRGEVKEAEKKVSDAEKIIGAMILKYKKSPGMKSEGAFKAAVEEYVEAVLLLQFVKKGKISKMTKSYVTAELYLAGLCDVPGELYRYAIKAATNKDYKLVEKCSQMANTIVEELIEFDLTKYLRTKFDQAKKAAQKIEIVNYELNLRRE